MEVILKSMLWITAFSLSALSAGWRTENENRTTTSKQDCIRGNYGFQKHVKQEFSCIKCKKEDWTWGSDFKITV